MDKKQLGNFDDFTEEFYVGVLRLLKAEYTTEFFGSEVDTPHALWRHDIDVSVQRGLRIAQLEAMEGVHSTFFFLLHSEFYSLGEKGTLDAAKRLLSEGHRAGLHFDVDFHELAQGDRERLEHLLLSERNQLEQYLECSVDVVSFHNPEIGGASQYTDDQVGGMVNASGSSISSRYEYVSDSNGVWRFRRLYDVLKEASSQRLHVLTHPVWWTPHPMPPRDRITRAIKGRAQATGRNYDRILSDYGRPNVRA